MRIASFRFRDYNDRRRAADLIYSNCNGSSAYDTTDYSDYYWIHILESCDNVERARKICSAQNGELADY